MNELVALIFTLFLTAAFGVAILGLSAAARNRWGRVPLIDPAWKWLHGRAEWLLRKIHLLD